MPKDGVNSMSRLTKAEKAWLEKLQTVLNECPSDRLGFYTIGDANVTVYDRSKEKAIDDEMWGSSRSPDFCQAVDKMNAGFGFSLDFPALVHSTAG